MSEDISNRIIDRYKVEQKLGKGGFGETFLATDTRMPSQRKVVIKRLKPDEQQNIDQQIINDAFSKEAAILEELGRQNPQIPELYDYFEEQGEYYLVQEYIPGKTLSKLSPISQAQVQEILYSLLETVQYIHNKGIIHRDIKPENIIVRDTDNLPVLIDFGAVKDSVSKVKLNSGSVVGSKIIGTQGYMAPEQSQGYPIFSSDLYALGRTMIFALTGKLPVEIDINPRTGELNWEQYVPDLNEKLAEVLSKANQLSPQLRYPTAEEMYQELNEEPLIPTIAVAPPPRFPETNPTETHEDNDTDSRFEPTVMSATPTEQGTYPPRTFFWTQKPNNLWRWPIGGTVIFAIVGFSAFITLEYEDRNNVDKQLQQAEDDYQTADYQSCISNAQAARDKSKELRLFNQNTFFEEANDLMVQCQREYDDTLLAQAQQLVENEQWIEAIEKSQEISANDSNIYQQSRDIISNSTQKILDQGFDEYDSTGEASNGEKIVMPLLAILAPDSEFYQQIKAKVEEWESEEEENKNKLDQARLELTNRNWNRAYDLANSVTTTFYKKQSQPIKDEAFHKNSEAKLETAKNNYNQGDLKGAIATIQQIPNNASVYTQATELKSQWDKELQQLEANIRRFINHYFSDINSEDYLAAWSHLSSDYKKNQDWDDYINWWSDKYVYLKGLEFDTKSNLLPLTVTVEYEYLDADKSNESETVNWCIRKNSSDSWKFVFEIQSACE